MSFDGRELRNAMGRFATGVCLITTVTEQQQALAMTANSFSSVSLDPPLALWNLQDSSDVYADFASPKHFAINILSSEQKDLSNHYAGKGQHEIDPTHFRSGKYGAPIIEGALVSLECELEAAYPGGDHLIIVGRILDMEQRASGEPLVFYAGGYRELRWTDLT